MNQEAPAQSYFLKMIQRLRQHEEIMLYGNVLQVTDEETVLVSDFLKTEFERESLHYPFSIPEYDAAAALWAAKTAYIAAQLILYRENNSKELSLLLPDYAFEQSASAILSADLCLRFLPDMIRQLHVVDSEDELVEVLGAKLQYWHFSGIGWDSLDIDRIALSPIMENACLYQRYCERIIHHRRIALAAHPLLNEVVSAQLGIHGQHLWKEFNRTTPPLPA